MALALAGARWPAWIGLAAFAAHLAWQIVRLDIGDPALCLRVFKSNRDAGLLLFAGLLLDAVMRAECNVIPQREAAQPGMRCGKTRSFRCATWRAGPGIHNHYREYGFRGSLRFASRPGMTSGWIASLALADESVQSIMPRKNTCEVLA